MAKTNETQIIHLTASGAVTTNAKPGILLYASVTGDTAGDKLEINDGATTRITLRVPAAHGQATYNPRQFGSLPQFNTDIDAVITTSNNVEATFVFKEVGI